MGQTVLGLPTPVQHLDAFCNCPNSIATPLKHLSSNQSSDNYWLQCQPSQPNVNPTYKWPLPIIVHMYHQLAFALYIPPTHIIINNYTYYCYTWEHTQNFVEFIFFSNNYRNVINFPIHSTHSPHHTCLGIVCASTHHNHHCYSESTHKLYFNSPDQCPHHTTGNNMCIHLKKVIVLEAHHHCWPFSFLAQGKVSKGLLFLLFVTFLAFSWAAFSHSACLAALSSRFFLCSSCCCNFIYFLSCFFLSFSSCSSCFYVPSLPTCIVFQCWLTP